MNTRPPGFKGSPLAPMTAMLRGRKRHRWIRCERSKLELVVVLLVVMARSPLLQKLPSGKEGLIVGAPGRAGRDLGDVLQLYCSTVLIDKT